MNVKKRISLIIGLVILLLKVNLCFAGEGINLKMDVEVDRGADRALVNLMIDKGSNLAAATLELVYDSDKLEVLDAGRGGDLTTGMVDVYHDKKTGTVRMAYINMDGFNGTGQILTVNFKIKEEARGMSLVSVKVEEFIDNKYQDIPFTVTPGYVEIINNDGKEPEADIVVIPYTLKEGEDSASLIVLEDDDVPLTGGYVEELEALVVKGKPEKDYKVVYNKVTFVDVPGDKWYHRAISYLGARGMVKGIGGRRYAPDSSVIRADFLIMAMNAFGIEPLDNLSDNFADVFDKYYTRYLATAKKYGFALGSGNNLFRPEDEISRQDMMLILHRILDYSKRLPVKKVKTRLVDFADYRDVSPYALTTVEFFIEHDVIRGAFNRINPLDSLTRAEAAQVLYNLLTIEITERSN